MTSPDPEDSGRSDTAQPNVPDTPAEADAARGDGGPVDGAPDPRHEVSDAARRAELPADVDAAFAAIVADWAAADAPRWPSDPDEPPARSSGIGTATPPQGHRALDPVPPADRTPPRHPREDPPDARRPEPPEDEHFVPPEPPPLPRLGLSSLAGLGLLVVGVVLLAVPSLVGGSIGVGLVPGLLAMTAGLGWLVFGLRRPREQGDGHGPDDGAIL